ncbi:subtilisin family serine protease [Arthrobacter ginsengisoli]|uniref:Subtilisin family serine protease n=1 Tax=Arthrobacter ginsengisoli TaxID=1356565 RepID=A0ABU1UBD6_9MICC|nr:S8 family serine peptidase [Arthrobacter ginsengisoli]MDR7082486.1 subtilisin family serine protease [Arthrobacter ginsengisoli]
MFSHVRRPGSAREPVLEAARSRQNPGTAASPPKARSRIRGLIGSLAALSLAVAGGFVAAVPATAAEQEQRYIVVLKDGADPGTAAATQQRGYGLTVSTVYREAVNGYAATMTASAAARLATDPGVDFVTVAREFKAPENPSASNQVAPNWRQRIGGTLPADGGAKETVDVNVAVIDSGIDASHPDLNVRGGIDCSTGSPVKVTPTDKVGHGTFVAGVIGAKDNSQGVIGAAPGTPLWSVRVVNDADVITEEMLICAIDWVTGTRKDNNADNDIEVANISIGGPGADTADCGKGTDPMHYAICRSVKAGVAYAVAAGNSSEDFARSVPATYDEVLTATAMADFDGKPDGLAAPVCGPDDWTKIGQLDDKPAFFSNFATEPKDKAHTVAAPGVCITSTSITPEGYAVAHGTSFASPAVAGSLARCISEAECGGSAKDVMSQFLKATAAYNKEHHGFGFDGDPLRPIQGQYYGYLAQIAGY